MKHPIVGFHRDEESHWVADLSCGHGQHVRHDPPRVERPWVLTDDGRASRIGHELDCVRCDALLARIDHLVYATPDLERGITMIAALTGVRAAPGGSHPGRGTRNALVALGPTCYLEIIGPDPNQGCPPRWFGMAARTEPALAGWAANAHDLATTVRSARAAGVPLGDVGAGQRTRPDGVELSWQLTAPEASVAAGVVPFLIDWGTSQHPARTAPAGLRLAAVRAESPQAAQARAMLEALALDMAVSDGPAPALVAMIETPGGRVQLR